VRLDQLRSQFPTGDLAQLDRNLADVPVIGDGTPGASNETFSAAAVHNDGGGQQMNTFDEEVGESPVTKQAKNRNAHATAMALHRRWQDLLPTLQRPLLEFISRTTGHIMILIAEGDLSPSCSQPGTCTIKEVQVLCLFLDHTFDSIILVSIS
jgi:hypothetical protein